MRLSTTAEKWFWHRFGEGHPFRCQAASRTRLRSRSGFAPSVHLAFERLEPVDVALDRPGAIRQGQTGPHRVQITAQPRDERVQFPDPLLAGGLHPSLQLVSAPVSHELREPGHMAPETLQLRAAGQDVGESDPLLLLQSVGVAGDPGGDLPDGPPLRPRLTGRGGRAPGTDVLADAGAPAPVTLGTDLALQRCGIGASLHEAFSQVGVEGLDYRGAFAGAVLGQEFFGGGGAGEAAHGVACQTELSGDLHDRLPLGKQVVDGDVALAGALGDPPLSRWGGLLVDRLGSGSVGVRVGGCRCSPVPEMIPVTCDDTLHRLAEISP